MKGIIEVDFSSEDVRNTLYEVIEDMVAGQMPGLVREVAAPRIEAEITKIIKPVVQQILTKQKFKFGRSTYGFQETLEQRLRTAVVEYLDQPCFVYSGTSALPSERLMKSAEGKSRLEHFMDFALESYFNEHIEARAAELIDRLALDEKRLNEMIRKQLIALIEERME